MPRLVTSATPSRGLPDNPPESVGSRSLFFILCTLAPIMVLSQGIISPILPLLGQVFGVGATMTGFLVTVFGLARLITDLPAGLAVGRLGARSLALGGPLLVALSSFLAAGSHSFWELAFFRFVSGVGSAMYTTSAMSILADIAPRRHRGQMMSLYQGAMLLGSGMGPAVGGFISEWFGQSGPFVVCGILALLAGTVVFASIPRAAYDSLRDLHEPERPQRNASMSWGDVRTADCATGNLRGFVLGALVTCAVFFTGSGARMTVIPLLMHNVVGVSASRVGLILGVIQVANLCMVYPSGLVADRLGRKAVMVPAMVISAVGLLLFSGSWSFGAFMPGAVLLGVGVGLAGGVPAAYIVDVTPQCSHGIAMGLYRSAADIGYVLGPLALGYVSDAVSYRSALVANSVLLLTCAALFGTLAPEPTERARLRKAPHTLRE